MTVRGAQVIVDYCHNAAGMRMLGDFAQRYADQLQERAHRGPVRRIGMIATAGDRRDEDIMELGSVAAKYFDTILVRDDDNLRRREPGEQADLVAQGIRQSQEAGDARCTSVEIILDERDATDRAMQLARPGDLVVLCVDKHAGVMERLEQHTKQAISRGDNEQDGPAYDPDFVRKDDEAAAAAPEGAARA